MDLTALQGAAQAFSAGAYARVCEMLSACEVGWPDWLAVWAEDPAAPLPPADEMQHQASLLALLHAAQIRTGQVSTVEALLTGSFWDVQTLQTQLLLNISLSYGQDLSDNPVVYYGDAELSDLLQVLLFDLALDCLKVHQEELASQMMVRLEGERRRVVSALLAQCSGQDLAPATLSLLREYADHPAVAAVHHRSRRHVRVNILTQEIFNEQILVKKLGGSGKVRPMLTTSAILLLSERAVTTEELIAELKLTNLPGQLIGTIRNALGEKSVVTDRGGGEYTYRMHPDLQISVDLNDLRVRATATPLTVLRRVSERLRTVKGVWPPVVAARLTQVISAAVSALQPSELAEGLNVVRELLPCAPDMCTVMMLEERLIRQTEGLSAPTGR